MDRAAGEPFELSDSRPATTSGRRRSKGACVFCRQMKLRCDSHERFPAPCSRCARRSSQCSFDASFKRTAKRDRLEALENELRMMREGLPNAPPTPDETELRTPDSRITISQGYNLSHEVDGSAAPPLPPPQPLTAPLISHALRNYGSDFTSKILEGIEVTPMIIRDLLEEYYLNYHPRFSILPELEMLISNYDTCPLLLWTVLGVASRCTTKHSHLYLRLADPVRKLAGDVVSSPRRSLGIVQALVLLCIWPFPFRELEADQSLSYCGLAYQMGLQLGLHHLGYDLEYCPDARSHDDDVRLKTWVSCFIVCQSVSSKFGLPCPFMADNSILNALASPPSTMPPAILQRLQIVHLTSNFLGILGEQSGTPSGLRSNPLPLIRTFEMEFHVLFSRYSPTWSLPTEISALYARLMLYSFAIPPFSSKSELHSSTPLSHETSSILSQAGTSAIQLIRVASSSPLEVSLWTSDVQTGVLFATFFLLKLLSCAFPGLDTASARNAMSVAWTSLQNRSCMDDDHVSRGCAIIEYLSRTEAIGVTYDGGSGLSMKAESRMSANLFLDTIWRARQRYGLSGGEEVRDRYSQIAQLLESTVDMQWNDEALPSLDFVLSEWDPGV